MAREIMLRRYRIEPALINGGFQDRGEKEAILKATGGTLALKETMDLSEIIGDVLCSPQYSMKYLNTHPLFSSDSSHADQDIALQLLLSQAIFHKYAGYGNNPNQKKAKMALEKYFFNMNTHGGFHPRRFGSPRMR
jgi:hypothetical protein